VFIKRRSHTKGSHYLHSVSLSVPEMTYAVSGGTLNPNHLLTHSHFHAVAQAYISLIRFRLMQFGYFTNGQAKLRCCGYLCKT